MLYNFGYGTDGGHPEAALIFDAVGNLYGTTMGGGPSGGGTVFELTPTVGGGWAENVLHTFNSNGGDGYWPQSQPDLRCRWQSLRYNFRGRNLLGRRDGVRVDARRRRGLDGDRCCIASATARTG